MLSHFVRATMARESGCTRLDQTSYLRKEKIYTQVTFAVLPGGFLHTNNKPYGQVALTQLQLCFSELCDLGQLANPKSLFPYL